MATFSTDEASGGGGAPTDAQYWTGAADATLSAEKNLGAFTGIVQNTAGTPTAADPAIQYISPAKTANVASATTLPILPETGVLVPITGTTQIDFITVPTGSAPRYAVLWFQSAINVRHEVAGAGAGTANISVMLGGAANQVVSFAANSFMPVVFDGTNWRRVGASAHWNGQAVQGNDSIALLFLDTSIGCRLQYNGTTKSVLVTDSRIVLQHALLEMKARLKPFQGSLASASNLAFPANAGSILVTGTTTVNTFTSTGWEEGNLIWLEFDNVLTITNNSGGTNDFLSCDGGDITTAAGMVIAFRFDGTDFREIDRPSRTVKGADVASAGTLAIGLPVAGDVFDVTGTTAIDYISTTGRKPGAMLILQFDATVTVNHNTGSVPANTLPVLLAAGAPFVATAGDTLTLYQHEAGWRELARTVI